MPAYFDDAQRQATRDAGRIAGLDVLRIVNEPTAAALAYGLDRRRQGTVAVYDLGGGTFDCSILSLERRRLQGARTNGDTYLGGDDFDRALVEVAAREIGRRPRARRRTRSCCSTCATRPSGRKIALSSRGAAEFALHLPRARPDLPARRSPGPSSRRCIAPLIDRTLDRCRAALRDAELTPARLDEVVLVGGSTRIPYVRRRVEEFFGRKPHTELNPDEVVALGRGRAGRHPHRRPARHAAARRGAAVARHRDARRRGGQADPPQQHDPVPGDDRYTTSVDNQTAIDINIYQGERELTKDCRLPGPVQARGIPPMPAQLPQVDVTFLVDANGMLTVTARGAAAARRRRSR